MSEQATVVDMEQKLAADSSGAYRDELVAGLATERSSIRRQMDAGLPPAEYEQATKLLAGGPFRLWQSCGPGTVPGSGRDRNCDSERLDQCNGRTLGAFRTRSGAGSGARPLRSRRVFCSRVAGRHKPTLEGSCRVMAA